MINLQYWAAKHNISHAALADLAELFGIHNHHELPPEVKGASESAVQSAVRLEASKKGVKLWRNNVGVMFDSRNVPVRYGLANDSKQLNEALKSADLIGWRPLLIRPHMIGWTVAQFVSRECKAKGWTWRGDDHERAQLAWARLVVASGGDAAFAAGTGTL